MTYILEAIFGQEAEQVHESNDREPNWPDQELFDARLENSANEYNFKQRKIHQFFPHSL